MTTSRGPCLVCGRITRRPGGLCLEHATPEEKICQMCSAQMPGVGAGRLYCDGCNAKRASMRAKNYHKTHQRRRPKHGAVPVCGRCRTVIARTRMYCDACVREVRSEAGSVRRGNNLPGPRHKCLDCPALVNERRLRCAPCKDARRLEYRKLQREEAKLMGQPEPQAVRKPKAPAWPCAGCRHGVASSVADTGWECGLMQAGRCRPWAGALLMEGR